MAANRNDFHTDVPLTNVAVSRFQRMLNFVAPFAAARMPVAKLSGLYDKWDMAAINRDDMHERGDNDRARETNFVKTQAQFKIPAKSIAVKLNELIQFNSDVQVNPATLVPRVLAMKAAISLEKQLATRFQSGVWYRTVTGTAGAETNVDGGPVGELKKLTDTAADPLPRIAREVENQGKLTGVEPNAMIFGRRYWRALRYHPEIRAALSSNGTPIVRNKPASLMEMAALLELEWCGVSKGIENTAGLNLPAVNDYIVPPESALLYFRPTSGGDGAVGQASDDPGTYSNEEPAALARLVAADAAGNADGMRVRALRDEFAGPGGSDHWEMDSFNAYHVVTQEMGTLFLEMA